MNKKLLIGAGAAVLVAGGAFVLWPRAKAPDTKTAAAAPLPPVKASDRVVADARVEPVRNVALTFLGGGTVAEVLVAEGEAVKAGQVLARLNAAQQQAALAQSEAALRRAEARLAELRAGARAAEIAAARANVDAAKAQLARVKQGPLPEEIISAEADVQRAEDALRLAATAAVALEAAGTPSAEIENLKAQLAGAQARLAKLLRGATPEEIAAAEAEVARAEASLDLTLAGARPEQIAAAEADVASARAAVDQARAVLDGLELRAPFAGVVGSVDVKAGEYSAPGQPAVRVADLTSFRFVTDNLTETKIVGVREGAAAIITVDALPGVELPGKVTTIKAYGEKKQGDITFTVIVLPDSQDARLRWNMTAAVSIEQAK
ncbi:MAG TPA: efflux RND transporter periplasmic adaptor subunit [Symbiobacteriaceae bacterium]|jgi:HlyD family secretion protein|nr:efflux RND transporter periplasmic adaptor subunit [Symbiobacteriaceae bacterium]